MNLFSRVKKDPAIEIALKAIKADEGEVKKGGRHVLYPCPAGKLTIGHGRNVEDRGLSDDEADYLFSNDLDIAYQDAKTFAAEAWDGLNSVRKSVLINMAFNLGLTKLMGFKTFRTAVRTGQFDYAAKRLESTLWYKQVGNRAKRLSRQLRTGEL